MSIRFETHSDDTVDAFGLDDCDGFDTCAGDGAFVVFEIGPTGEGCGAVLEFHYTSALAARAGKGVWSMVVRRIDEGADMLTVTVAGERGALAYNITAEINDAPKGTPVVAYIAYDNGKRGPVKNAVAK